ncbi:hypothetical protein NEFER03_2009 [Nematocida sp. LUAm3]|nr:hypothetical protein NEFER03_2009 [Nematocida sp. LUAm3]KAI5174483.1 hypothetical protein NEFER02_0604 [Nematocida sp. LUAm2]KAI5179134.1 hypothetical protein NEFER01_1997 [Nematocida sp. LUAm1]
MTKEALNQKMRISYLLFFSLFLSGSAHGSCFLGREKYRKMDVSADIFNNFSVFIPDSFLEEQKAASDLYTFNTCEAQEENFVPIEEDDAPWIFTKSDGPSYLKFSKLAFKNKNLHGWEISHGHKKYIVDMKVCTLYLKPSSLSDKHSLAPLLKAIECITCKNLIINVPKMEFFSLLHLIDVVDCDTLNIQITETYTQEEIDEVVQSRAKSKKRKNSEELGKSWKISVDVQQQVVLEMVLRAANKCKVSHLGIKGVCLKGLEVLLEMNLTKNYSLELCKISVESGYTLSLPTRYGEKTCSFLNIYGESLEKNMSPRSILGFIIHNTLSTLWIPYSLLVKIGTCYKENMLVVSKEIKTVVLNNVTYSSDLDSLALKNASFWLFVYSLHLSMGSSILEEESERLRDLYLEKVLPYYGIKCLKGVLSY